MKIGLVDVDGHAKKKKRGATIYPNLALCKIARYHKESGDEVEWAIPFYHYDRIYMAKVFNFTPDDLTAYDADEIIKGGTGYYIRSQLPEKIDRLQPDYSIYPHIPKDTAYGFLIDTIECLCSLWITIYIKLVCLACTLHLYHVLVLLSTSSMISDL